MKQKNHGVLMAGLQKSGLNDSSSYNDNRVDVGFLTIFNVERKR